MFSVPLCFYFWLVSFHHLRTELYINFFLFPILPSPGFPFIISLNKIRHTHHSKSLYNLFAKCLTICKALWNTLAHLVLTTLWDRYGRPWTHFAKRKTSTQRTAILLRSCSFQEALPKNQLSSSDHTTYPDSFPAEFHM